VICPAAYFRAFNGLSVGVYRCVLLTLRFVSSEGKIAARFRSLYLLSEQNDSPVLSTGDVASCSGVTIDRQHAG